MSPSIEWTLMIVGWLLIFSTYSITRYKEMKVNGGIKSLKSDEMRIETMKSNIVFILYFIAAGMFVHLLILPDFIQYEYLTHYFHFYLGIFIFAIAIWLYAISRIALGSNWSWKGDLIRDRTKLIRRGPYSIIRHPTFTAFILAGFASGIMIAASRIPFFMILMLPILYWRAKIDEKHLIEIFPEYKEYIKKTRMFF